MGLKQQLECEPIYGREEKKNQRKWGITKMLHVDAPEVTPECYSSCNQDRTRTNLGSI